MTLSSNSASAEINGVLLQAFHWYTPADGGHWRRLQQQASDLAQAGITALWLPPAGKGLAGAYDVGYGIYDPYDLGEFDQQGSIATKYGTRAEYLAAVAACHSAGMQVYADAVFNHLMGADEEEDFNATPYDPYNRFQPLGDQRLIRGWTRYSYPGRGGAHSTMQWHWWHFDAVDYNSFDPGFQAVWRIEGKAFDVDVDLERGNFDYLMGCDLDIDHPEVRAALKHWGSWMVDTAGVDGFRLDAIKHISGGFFPDWLSHVEAPCRPRPVCGGRILDEEPGHPQLVCRSHPRSHSSVRCAAAPQFPSGQPGRLGLRPAPSAGRHPDAPPAPAGRDPGGEPRHPAPAGPGIGGGTLVQAPGLCLHSAAA
ncbi:MAG: alpha-amylase family glycosyl hydrolase [Cyanobium sp.]